MPESASLTVRRFEAADQDAARRLVLEGLGAHFGVIDETLNPDLDDVAASFSDGVFFVALVDQEIVGTGGFHLQPDGTANVVRMSTAAALRRRGVASAVLTRLLDEARHAACHRITLETNADWHDAIGFYRARGFNEALRTETGVVFVMTI